MRRRKAQAIQAKQSTEMVALMLPVSGKHLLLPSVALAEITPMPEVRPVTAVVPQSRCWAKATVSASRPAWV